MTIPARNLYQKFGDPYRVVEFRMFSFNGCEAGCKNCFYQKRNNDYWDFAKSLSLAEDLKQHGYHLETCYILPTDVFENSFNYQVFFDEKMRQLLAHFDYVGMGTTLRNGYDQGFLDSFFENYPNSGIEMHVNLLEESLTDKAYEEHLRAVIGDLRTRYGERILINLAYNAGGDLNEDLIAELKRWASALSEDKILEVNFTFLFNNKVPQVKKAQMIQKSYPLLSSFTAEFEKNETGYNSRTLLRKPSFTFKDERIYLNPILPFDEYVHIEDSRFVLNSPTFESFLNTYNEMEKMNTSKWKECEECQWLSVCYGKSFFSIANYFNINCIRGVVG